MWCLFYIIIIMVHFKGGVKRAFCYQNKTLHSTNLLHVRVRHRAIHHTPHHTRERHKWPGITPQSLPRQMKQKRTTSSSIAWKHQQKKHVYGRTCSVLLKSFKKNIIRHPTPAFHDCHNDVKISQSRYQAPFHKTKKRAVHNHRNSCVNALYRLVHHQ